MDFSEWKFGPVRDILERAFGFDVTQCLNWDSYGRAILRHRDRIGGDEFVDRARRADAVLSSGERTLLRASLFAADYAWLGDDLATGKFLEQTWYAGLDQRFARATAAVFLRQDPPVGKTTA